MDGDRKSFSEKHCSSSHIKSPPDASIVVTDER